MITKKQLIQAIKNNDIQTTKQYIAENKEVSFADLKLSEWALCCSAEHGHFEMIKLLIENGVNVNVGYGKALYSAMKNKHYEIARYLIKNGIYITDLVFPLKNIKDAIIYNETFKNINVNAIERTILSNKINTLKYVLQVTPCLLQREDIINCLVKHNKTELLFNINKENSKIKEKNKTEEIEYDLL